MSQADIDEFADQTAATLTAAGFPRMEARVLMALMTAETGTATADELMTRLGASAAAISGAVRYLQTIHIIRRSTLAGTRRHVYGLPDHAWYATTDSQAGLYTSMIELATKGVAVLPEGSQAQERVAEMADYFRFLRERMPQLMEEWRASRNP